MEGTCYCANPGEMRALGQELAVRLTDGGVLALDGDLGARKTELVKGLAAGLGYQGAVTSPTFTLLHEYHGSARPLFHFDFYRIGEADEILDLGWDECIEQGGVLAVEWAGRFPALLPATTIFLKIEIPPGGGRRISMVPCVTEESGHPAPRAEGG